VKRRDGERERERERERKREREREERGKGRKDDGRIRLIRSEISADIPEARGRPDPFV